MRQPVFGLMILPLAVSAAEVAPSLAIERAVAMHVVQRDSAGRMEGIANEAAGIASAIATSPAPEKTLRSYAAGYRAELARLGITGKNAAQLCTQLAANPAARYLSRTCGELNSGSAEAVQPDSPARAAGVLAAAVPAAITSVSADSIVVPQAANQAAASAAPAPSPPGHGTAARAMAGDVAGHATSRSAAPLAGSIPARAGKDPRRGAVENGPGGTGSDPLPLTRLAVAVLAVATGTLWVMCLRQHRRLRKLVARPGGSALRVAVPPPGMGPGTRATPESSVAPLEGMARHRALTMHGRWKIFHTTMQGRGHSGAEPPQPCQDRHRVHPIANGWGVAVVCDGAGSQACSEVGAEFVAQHLVELVSEKLATTAMFRDRCAPSEDGWRAFAKALMLDSYLKLEAHVGEVQRTRPDISMENVGCTVILVIYAPFGLLMAHIGDGQAGYRDSNGWHPMMTPFKGEYGNQTIFLTNRRMYATQLENPADPGNPFMETRVINVPVRAFTLMSDGMENGLYETVIYDTEAMENRVVNRPHGRAFEQIIERLCSFGRETGALEKMQDEFLLIVDKGNKNLVQELDDKTLVLALCGT